MTTDVYRSQFRLPWPTYEALLARSNKSGHPMATELVIALDAYEEHLNNPTWHPREGALVKYQNEIYTISVFSLDADGELIANLKSVYQKNKRLESVQAPLTELTPVDVAYRKLESVK